MRSAIEPGNGLRIEKRTKDGLLSASISKEVKIYLHNVGAVPAVNTNLKYGCAVYSNKITYLDQCLKNI